MTDRLRPAKFLGLLTFAFVVLSLGYTINILPPVSIFTGLALAVLFVVTMYEVKYGLFVLLFFMLFSPEVLVGESAVAGRGVSFRLDDVVIMTIFFAWLARMAFTAEKGTWRKSPLNFLLILFVFINLFSSVNGLINETVALKTTILFTGKKIQYIAIFFLVFNSIEKEREIKFFFILSLIICGIICLWGYYMIGTGQITGRFYGPYDHGESNTIAAYFVMNMSLAVGLIFNYRKQALKTIPIYLLILLILIPFALTFSRGGYVAMLASMLVLALFKGQKVVLIPILVFLFLMKFILPAEMLERIASISYVFGPSEETSVQSWDDRLGMWNRAIYRWQKHPYLGSGPGSFDLGGIDNQYVMELASIGIFGLTVFLMIIALVLYITIKVIRETDDPFIKHISIGFFAGTVGYLVNGLSMSVFILIRTMEPFWFHTGLICFAYRGLVVRRRAMEQKAAEVPDTLPGITDGR
jgi:O-antigen ligase